MNQPLRLVLPESKEANPVCWSAALCVHDKDLDHDHRLLFEHIDRIESLASSESAIALCTEIDRCLQFVRQHFAKEERLMVEGGYAHYDKHRRAHWLLGEKLENAAAQLGDYRLGPNGIHRLAAADKKALAMLVRKWFVAHIQEEDMAMTAALGSASRPRKSRNPVPRKSVLSLAD